MKGSPVDGALSLDMSRARTHARTAPSVLPEVFLPTPKSPQTLASAVEPRVHAFRGGGLPTRSR